MNGYQIDFGYSPATPQANEPTVISLHIRKDEAPQDYSSVWVRISNEEKVLFSSDIHPKNGVATFSYTFSEPGDYELAARFENDSNILAQTDFLLKVSENTNESGNENPTDRQAEDSIFIFAALLIAGMIGAIGSRMFLK
ncbi:MAG TPA: hypothetical protein VJG83_02765 [archaeon]|nr:hypothetical protein [archaeon]